MSRSQREELGRFADPTPEHAALRETVTRFAAEVVPQLDAWEARGSVPHSVHHRAAEFGLLGIGFPEQVGGSGGDLTHALTLVEELCRSGASSGLCAALLTHHISLPHLIDLGTRHHHDRYVRPTLAGETIGSLALTEPGAGSDVRSLTSRAIPDAGGWRLAGTKQFITSAARADFLVVAARTGEDRGLSLFVVDADTAGVRVSEPHDKLGWRCSDTAEIVLDDVLLDSGALLGAPGAAWPTIAHHLAWERLFLAAQAYSTGMRCIDLATAWVTQRHAFGGPLADKQLVQYRLAEALGQMQAARSLVWSVTRDLCEDRPVAASAAMAKAFATSAAQDVVATTLSLHGGTGAMTAAEVSRHYRDMPILSVGGGATDVLHDLVGRHLVSSSDDA